MHRLTTSDIRHPTSLVGVLLILAACAAPPADKPGVMAETEQGLLDIAAGAAASGNPDSAADMYEQMIARGQGSATPYLRLSRLQHGKGQTEAALATLAKARAKFDGDARIPAARGVLLDRLGKHAEAQLAYREAVKLNPKDARSYNNLGLSMILNGQYDEAIGVLEPLLIENPSATTRQNLALAYGLKGDETNAYNWAVKDVSPEQAKENLRFYEYYRTHATPLRQALPEPEAAPDEALNADETEAAVEEKTQEAATPEEENKKEATTPAAESTENPVAETQVENEKTTSETAEKDETAAEQEQPDTAKAEEKKPMTDDTDEPETSQPPEEPVKEPEEKPVPEEETPPTKPDSKEKAATPKGEW